MVRYICLLCDNVCYVDHTDGFLVWMGRLVELVKKLWQYHLSYNSHFIFCDKCFEYICNDICDLQNILYIERTSKVLQQSQNQYQYFNSTLSTFNFLLCSCGFLRFLCPANHLRLIYSSWSQSSDINYNGIDCATFHLLYLPNYGFRLIVAKIHYDSGCDFTRSAKIDLDTQIERCF